ncbi:hypothetical protein B296_00005869 [Ensete ventricosum]|uniref:Uncharacterized protein n=1 Tax=Ensete ventricosum TaxID=4639 RepID=A0A427AM20_ENSVE|nr:hypothetical protein B296_00005869 [Ensete ventricosum]
MLFGRGDRLWTPSRFQGVDLLLEAGDAIVHKGVPFRTPSRPMGHSRPTSSSSASPIWPASPCRGPDEPLDMYRA